MGEKIFYVYAHKKIDTGEIFYIGKGKLGRCYSSSGRNKHWVNTVNKHGGYTVSFVKTCMSEAEAFDIEIKAIYFYRSIGLNLCNKSNGGEGNFGVVHTDETKMKFRMAKLGKKQKPEHAKKSASIRVGQKNTPEHTEATISKKRKKVINSDGELFISASDAARKVGSRIGVKCSQGNISMCCRGLRNEAYGYNWSYDITKKPAAPTGINPLSKKIKNVTTGDVFNSCKDAVHYIKDIGISKKPARQHISRCARGESKFAYGFEWEYV